MTLLNSCSFGCKDPHHRCVMCGKHTYPDVNRLGRCAKDQAKFDDPVIPAESLPRI